MNQRIALNKLIQMRIGISYVNISKTIFFLFNECGIVWFKNAHNDLFRIQSYVYSKYIDFYDTGVAF